MPLLRGFLQRHRCIELALALLFVHLVDVLVSNQLTVSGVLSGQGRNVILLAENLSDAAFALTLLLFLVAMGLKNDRLLHITLLSYISVATINLLDNLAALVAMANEKRGQPLYMLWDVFLIYVMNIVVFSAWYMIIDRNTPGGGFLFPKGGDPARPTKEPSYLDYLFISFNASSTFGPTVEALLSRKGKVLMMIQTLISLAIVTVLVARVVGEGGGG